MIVRLRRLKALIVVECRLALRSPGTITTVFAAPALLLLLFAYSQSLDTERVPVAIVLEQPTPQARDLAGALHNTRYFHSVFFRTRPAAEQALLHGEVNGVVVLAGDFSRAALAEGDAPVQVLIDGVDARVGRIVAGYVEGAVATWLFQRTLLGQIGGVDAVRTESRIWFNEEIDSRRFLMPGLIVLLMTVVSPLLSALVVAREWERGTIEAMLATPMTVADLLLAKMLVYFALTLAAVALTVGLTVTALEVPFRGSLLPLGAAASLFALSSLGLGLVISCATKNQFAVGRWTLLTGYLPAYMLSGFIFDLRNMPEPVQWISCLVSARYFVSILQTVLLAGDIWPVILPNLAGMAAIATVLLGTAMILVRKRLG